MLAFGIVPFLATARRCLVPAADVTRTEHLQIFGPVASVLKFSSEEEVLELANSSIYGLGAGVFTNDAKQAMRVSGELSSGSASDAVLPLLPSGPD